MAKIGSVTKGILIMIAIISACIMLQSKPADAMTFKITNNHGQKMYTALIYYTNTMNGWRVRGWYAVDPHSTKTINVNDCIKYNYAYIHAHTSEASWGSEKSFTVVNAAFDYVLQKQPSPTGNGRRSVGFDKYYAENNGTIYASF